MSGTEGRTMEIRYSRELDASWLIIEEEEPSDPVSAKMAELAAPVGLLRMESRVTEEGREYRYAIDGLKSLEASFGTREIEAAEIRSLMHALYRVSNGLGEYLLEPDRLFLEPGLIYQGREGWRFCYDPSRKAEFFGQLQALSRWLLKKCSHGDGETSRVAYELFRVCHEENYSFTQIWEALEMPEPGLSGEDEAEGLKPEKREGFFARLGRFMGF